MQEADWRRSEREDDQPMAGDLGGNCGNEHLYSHVDRAKAEVASSICALRGEIADSQSKAWSCDGASDVAPRLVKSCSGERFRSTSHASEGKSRPHPAELCAKPEKSRKVLRDVRRGPETMFSTALMPHNEKNKNLISSLGGHCEGSDGPTLCVPSWRSLTLSPCGSSDTCCRSVVAETG